MAKSSVRKIRGRQAATRDFNRLVSLRPAGEAGKRSAEQFMEGYEFIRRDVISGWTPEESFDLSTSVKGASRAFHDGANAARQLFNDPKQRAYADKLAHAYGVTLPA